MNHRGGEFLLGWLPAAMMLSCIGANPALTLKLGTRADATPRTMGPDAGPSKASPRELPESATRAGAFQPEVSGADWSLIDSGLNERGEVQPCAPTTRFATLASVIARPVPGLVSVRGKAWVPASYPCTAGIPEACHATPVLALSKPTERGRKQIHLVGNVAPNARFACTGTRDSLKCPVPLSGREYGVTGVLQGSSGDSELWLELLVDKLCRFSSENEG